MNLVYLHSHDSGRWLEPYNRLIPTPAIRTFSEQAAVFTNAHTVCPTCSPSRACLLTGTYPHQNGMMGLAHMGFSLQHPEWHLATILQQKGYRTLLAGIQHEIGGPSEESCSQLGYEAYIGEREWQTTVMERDRLHAQHAANFLLSEESRKEPFYLSVGFYNTHRIYRERPPWTGPLPAGIPDNEAGRQDFAGYADSLRLLDDCIGVVLDALRQGGHEDDTIIFLTTDHGPAFPGMKCCPSDLGTGVALMLRYPGNPAAGQQIQGMVSHLDVLPTLYPLLGIPVPSWCEGQSLLPLVEGKKDEVHDYLITSINTHVVEEPCRAIRTKRYKWVRYFGPQAHEPALPNIDNGPMKFWLYPEENNLPQRAECQLYDLENDPMETTNLAENPNYAEIQKELDEKLIAWMAEKEDPLYEDVSRPPKSAVGITHH